eukprot:6987999-Pyramimonas_sp.AAC.1
MGGRGGGGKGKGQVKSKGKGKPQADAPSSSRGKSPAAPTLSSNFSWQCAGCSAFVNMRHARCWQC